VKGIITKIKDNLTKMEEKFPKMGGDVKKIMEDNLTKSEDVLKILIEKISRAISRRWKVQSLDSWWMHTSLIFWRLKLRSKNCSRLRKLSVTKQEPDMVGYESENKAGNAST
jgi:hypothetical protein